MNSHVDLILAAEAVRRGRAQRRTTVRHVHLSDRPFGLVVFQMAHEPFSALAVGFGASADELESAVVIEPRNPHLLFRALTPLARRFCEWFRTFAHPRERIARRAGTSFERALDAPQLWVSNGTTAEILSRWGRRFAYQRTDGPLPADPALVEFGRHLQFLGEQVRVPGQALVVPATVALRRHWITGQSELEDANLATLDAWIDPPRGLSGFDAAARLEDDAVGPLLQPNDENEIFELIGELNSERRGSTDTALCRRLASRLEEKCAPHVQRAWRLVWRTLDREREFSAGQSVGDRWAEDRRAYTDHFDWTDGGGRRRARDSARRAAQIRLRLEAAQTRLDAQEANDDPLVMAAYELAGKAFTGIVREVDREHREQGPRRMVRRPLLTVETEEPCVMPDGIELDWSADHRVCGCVQAIEPMRSGGSRIVVKIVAGMNLELPARGSLVCFSGLSTASGPRLPIPQQIPWTHRPSESPVVAPVDDPAAPSWEGAP